MVLSKVSLSTPLGENEVAEVLARTCADLAVHQKSVLVIIPDGTRTSPLPLLCHLLYRELGRRTSRLDFLVALGTHQAMSPEALSRLIGSPVNELGEAADFPGVHVYNHRWDDPQALQTIGTIGHDEAAELTDGLLTAEIPVRLNRLITTYDQLIICGPVFPHEVAGFSGGAKYLFPGIAGAEIINFTHWLGALVTSTRIIGVKQTPVRRVIQRAAEFVRQPLTLIALVLKGHDLHGLYCGPQEATWSEAADLSARLNIIHTGQAYQSVLAMPALRYDDLWTAGKAMYKTEGTIADGGEVIIYAPHVSEISYTHGHLLDQVGYHVRDYFTKQWARFQKYPGGILAHSTHVKGLGTYDPATGTERPRIQVTLATSIPEERCRRVNLGFRDYRSIHPQDWARREDEGYLLVEEAGEVLYQI